jgi:hypothetical protein
MTHVKLKIIWVMLNNAIGALVKHTKNKNK